MFDWLIIYANQLIFIQTAKGKNIFPGEQKKETGNGLLPMGWVSDLHRAATT